MSDAFPSAILDSVLKQSRSPIFRNKCYINLHIPLQKLQSNLELIKDVINEAELLAVMFPRFFRERVCELQRVLYEADDLFDEAIIRSTSGSGMVENVVSYLHNHLFGLTLAPKMKDINRRLGVIIDEFCRDNLIVTGETGGPIARKGILRYHPDFVGDDELQMIGREDDKREVIKILFDQAPSNFIAIRGKAGVGKTTLCRAVYLDEDVKRHFEIRLWVDFGSVGGFSSINYWKKIITTLKLTEEAHLDPGIEEDQLEAMFATFIAKRKTLLVLDNATTHNFIPFIWSTSFQHGKDYWHEKSKILMPQVGESMEERPCNPYEYRRFNVEDRSYELRDLSEKHSRSIFERSAFGGNASVNQRDLMISLGKQILTRCRRNPAVLKGVGTLLYGKDNRRDMWEYFAHDFDFDSEYLHYNQISNVRRQFLDCHHYFGYLSLFDDAELIYEDLMYQFAANGFEFSDLARVCTESYLMSYWGDKRLGERKCQILPGSKEIFSLFAGAESIRLGSTNDVIPKFTRHVSISSSAVRRQKGMLPDSLLEDVVHRRTLLFFEESFPKVIRVQTLDVLFSHLRYLRVLSLQDMRLRKIPRSIGKLIHLKYLNLSGNSFRELPVSVCSLKNLWTLKLIHCRELKWFPGRITNFSQLRHLEINMCLDLIYMPPAIAKLTTLQRLDRFVVSSSKGGLKYLEYLDNLNGNLSIELPRKWKDSKEDSKRANLKGKKGLTSLEFKWYGANQSDSDDHDVLKRLKPCPGIENLFVDNFGGREFPRWFTSSVCLNEITLSRCANCSVLPPFGRLPKLRRLILVSMSLEYLEEKNNYNHVTPFPSLEELRIGCMPNLKAWWSDVSILLSSRINVVAIWRCPSLMYTPPFSNIHELILQDYPVEAMQSIGGTEMFSSTQGMVLPSSKLVVMFPQKLIIRDCNQYQMLLTNDDKGMQMGGYPCEDLVIENCPMENLSASLKRLRNLRFLRISKCSEKLDCLYDNTKGGMPWRALRALRRLTIEGFENLIALPRALQYLTALEVLEIKDCPRLKHLSSTLEHLIILNQLTLSKCSKELDCLFVEADNGMPWKAQALRRLTVEGFENLTALPRALQKLTELKELEVKDCPRLEHLSSTLERLTRLNQLTLSKCSEELDCLFVHGDNGMPWKSLQVLRSLTIEGFEKLTALPRALQQLTELKELEIKDCPRLEHLSSTLEHLTRLNQLTLSKCSEELDCLFVEDDNGMPWKALQELHDLTIEGFENLTALTKSLQYLSRLNKFEIKDCKYLERGANSLPNIWKLVVKSCPLFSKSIKEFRAEQPDARVYVDK